LTAIVDHPDHAVLSDSMRETVRRLARRRSVAVVSGRDREDIETLVGIDGIVYAGNHGFDISGSGIGASGRRVGDDHTDVMASVGETLNGELAEVSGVLVEVKRFSVAVHYRNVAEKDVAAVNRALDAFRDAHPAFRVLSGKKVHEILPPVDWNKGRAVMWLLEILDIDGSGALPIYIGDDVTDEDAFEAIRGRGIGICVADPGRERGPTAADYRVNDIAEVEEFLAGLA
jgi:alpha,alpha-trehalase